MFTCKWGQGSKRDRSRWDAAWLVDAADAFVFCLASDCDVGFEKSGWEGKAYQHGVLRADRIVAQTETQRSSLQRALGLEAEVVPMAVIPLVRSARNLGDAIRVRLEFFGSAALPRATI